MKVNRFISIVVCLMLSVAASCNSISSEKSRKPVSKIEVSAEQLPLGSSLKVDVIIKLNGGKLQKAELYLDNELVYTSTATSFTHEIDKLTQLGRHQLKIVAVKDDGQEGVNFKNIDVLSTEAPVELQMKVVASYPHNPTHFTEGLEVYNGEFYESTGNNGASGIYEFDLKTGKIKREIPLDKKYFGEGLTILNNKIYQLTYKAKVGFVYDYQTLKQIDTFSYSNKEGWGLTNDRKNLIKSDGTEFIDVFDKDTYEVVRRIAVCDNKGAIRNINELEYYNGVIYANVWMTNLILKVDAKTGEVLAKIDCSQIFSLLGNVADADVLNGIAIDKSNGKIYITGKYFDKILEVQFVEK
ncbi:MAG: glutaminyl-peptide cyclotransferase [Mangrovibacterium sp.]